MTSRKKQLTNALCLCAALATLVIGAFAQQPNSQAMTDNHLWETVARVRSDMRSLATAIESYYIDNNAFPAWVLGSSDKSIAAGNAALSNMPTFHRTIGAQQAVGGPFSLTTPIAYLTRQFHDPFNSGGGNAVFSYCANSDNWIVLSPGPDGAWDVNPIQILSGPVGQRSAALMALAYDPTNGAVSRGDIFRVRQ